MWAAPRISRTGQLQGIKMKISIVVLVWAFAGNCAAACTDVKSVGNFSNFQWTDDADPHLVEGYTVSLFKCESGMFGDVKVATGSSEPVRARLYDLELDNKTGRLSFRAKYSDGHESSKAIGPGGREARILLSFFGSLRKRSLTGVFIGKDAYANGRPDAIQRQVLRRDEAIWVPKSDVEFDEAYPTPTW